MDLSGWRKKIDALDLQILRLLNERAHAAKEIGKLKGKSGAAIYEPDRERTIVANLHAANKGPLSNEDLVMIYERIIEIMRSLQTRK